MKDLFEVAKRVQEFLDAQGWQSCIIGGISVQRWGEPRLTRDVDVTLLAGLGNEGVKGKLNNSRKKEGNKIKKKEIRRMHILKFLEV